MERYNFEEEENVHKWYHRVKDYYFIHPKLMDYVWVHVLFVTLLHSLYIYAVLQLFSHSLWYTLMWGK